jgi:L-iditol 2-dehydrogenase
MKQAIMTAPGRIEIREIETPELGPGQVLLQIRRIGVCGSDVHVYHGEHPYTSYPVVQGHEFSASVVAVGAGVTGPTVGMKVTATPQIVCGECGPCLRGDYHICDHLKVEGFQAPGCAQEYWLVDAERIVPLPDGFSYEQGALVEPAAVAVHAVDRAGAVDGRDVVVLGAGPIGNLVGQVAQAGGAQVLITDLSDYRLEVARQCGLQHTSNAGKETLETAAQRAFRAAGFALALECVGVQATMTAAIENIQKGGAIVVVGVFGEKPQVDLGLVQDHELHIKGTLMYQRQDYERAVELISAGKIITAPLVSKHFPLEQYMEAYHFIEAQGDRSMKILIDVA